MSPTEVESSSSSVHHSETQARVAQERQFSWAVLFVLFTEFCERFHFYGLRVMLPIYLTNERNYDKYQAKFILDAFTFFCYFFVIIGAFLGDSYLGKFHAVIFTAFVATIGSGLFALNVATELPFHNLLLILVAFGVGGMKPCLLAFGGDQYRLPQQIKPIGGFFSCFYLAINLAAVTATYIAPRVSKWLGFWLPAFMMALASALFIYGRVWYQVIGVTNKSSVRIFRCIFYALRERYKRSEKKAHWLEHAAPRYDDELIADLKETLRILILFIPMPLFWAIYYEQWGSSMRRLSFHMNRFFHNKLVEPIEHFNLVNPICVVIYIPIFKFAIYPCLRYVHLLRKHLQRIIAGNILASVAFICAGILALEVEKYETINGLDNIFYNKDVGHFYFLNNAGCHIKISMQRQKNDSNLDNLIIPTDGIVRKHNIEWKRPKENKEFDTFWVFHYSDCLNDEIDLVEPVILYPMKLTLISYLYTRHLMTLEDSHRHIDGYPLIRVVVERQDTRNNTNFTLNFYYKENLSLAITNYSMTMQYQLPLPGVYSIKLHDTVVVNEYEFKVRNLYLVTIRIQEENGKEKFAPTIWELMSNDRIDCDWLWLPSIVLAGAEVMFAKSSMEFAYRQAPQSMKCFVQACWLLTVAIGILLMYMFEWLIHFDKISTNFFVLASIVLVDSVVLAFLSSRYKYANN